MVKEITATMKRAFGRHVAKKPAHLPENKKIVSFTFDDFPKSSIDNGAKILESNGLYGTFYASLGMEHIGTVPGCEEMLSLAERGHDVGCHTYNHTHCGEMSSECIQADCLKNRQLSESIAGVKMDHFAYPFGEYKPSTKKVISKMYDTARTVQPAINSGCIDLTALCAVPIDTRRGVAFANSFIDKLNNRAGWLIFYTHDVCNNPSTYGCTPEQLSEVIHNCREAGYEILPVSKVSEMCSAA